MLLMEEVVTGATNMQFKILSKEEVVANSTARPKEALVPLIVRFLKIK